MNFWRKLCSFFWVIGFETCCFAHLPKAFDKVIDDWLFREGTPVDYFIRPLFCRSRREIKVMSEPFDCINVDRLRWECRERWDWRRMNLSGLRESEHNKMVCAFHVKEILHFSEEGREGFSQKKNSRQRNIMEWLSFNKHSWKRIELDESREKLKAFDISGLKI